GSHETLLAYLVRRLLENGANSSFVNRIVDPAVDIAELVADPVARARSTGGSPHPRIPLPVALYADRRNSHGLDLSDEGVLGDLEIELAAAPPQCTAAPIFASPPNRAPREALAIVNPGDHRDVVGTVEEADAADVAHAVAMAAAPGNPWSALSADERAACLERAADLLEDARARLVLLAVREAGKTVANAVGEVREAADFCRYYAAQARRELAGTTPRGPLACIAPWNFPLAIFTGQISAALAAGNPVLAKPAEQTPLIAAEAIRIFHRAGVPPAALQMLPGRGETVGATLVADPRIAGVLFTGSTAVAQLINRTLALRDDDPVLIAETGGQNAMIVDSSALPEQVVADALTSAFDSAGQRCSALRVLCVQDDIASHVLPMLEGALRELVIGDTRSLATDVGPVIDRAAKTSLDEYVARWRAAGVRVVAQELPPGCANGTFVAPTLIEIAHPEQLTREVFGPVLHVVRFREGTLPQLIDALNASGYGLTHGIQTRIDETVDFVCQRIRAGNIYVNRNIVGAVVGVQPFGGEALSGTGPKAGGPHYLWRLVRESPPPAAAASSVALSGPTGETNTLYLRPRGRVACIAATESALRAQALLATQLGNIALLADTAAGKRVCAALGGQCVVVEDPLGAAPDAVLYAGADDVLATLRQRLAAQDGPLVPVVAARGGRYDSRQLRTERTVTVNTTASGGNASLLSLEEEEPA
ncbi:MAG: bifunctional proline dehydrogenase/L-glutamate gamma-semialdehyde dehydrogenase PutA, partial [Casimicrobiaceae bacterium]